MKFAKIFVKIENIKLRFQCMFARWKQCFENNCVKISEVTGGKYDNEGDNDTADDKWWWMMIK